MSDTPIMRIPLSLPCQVPVFPGTPSTAEPIEERTECCAVDGWWMIGQAIICDWHLRELLGDGYEPTVAQWPDCRAEQPRARTVGVASPLRAERVRTIRGASELCRLNDGPDATRPERTRIMADRCAVKIRWGTTLEHVSQCEKDEDHYDLRVGNADMHEGPGLAEFPYQRISWVPGDRREFVGEWPGNCDRTPGCILHLDHHGRCAT